MHSFLYHASLGTAVMLVLVLRCSIADAQPTPAAPLPPSASRQAEAKKLTDEAIAAESNKYYNTAIALYKQAYQLVPHPTLIFNVGQAYMLSGNYPEAVKYFRYYLAHNPNGPAAPIARKFLASLPVPGSSRLPAVSQPQTTSPPSSGTLEAATSGAARGPEQTHSGAEEVRPPTGGISSGDLRVPRGGIGQNRPEQIEPTIIASDLDDPQYIAPARNVREKEAQKRATTITYTGYILTGSGVVLGVVAVGFLSQGSPEAGLGMGLGALGVALGGLATIMYGSEQRRAAKAVAWSPVVSAGFAGVALGGSLP